MKLSKYIVALVLLISIQANAQVSNLSPYSRYGLGNLQLSASTQLQTMGHGVSTYADPFVINSDNPATYYLANKPVFDANFKASFVNLSSENGSIAKRNMSISGFRFMFPLLANKIGLSFGLTPYSSARYFVKDTKNDPSIGDVSYEYEGSGGINKVYLGIGAKVLGNDSLNVAIGANGIYMFGFSDKTRRALMPEGSSYFNVSSINKISISDFTSEASIIVNWQPKKSKFVSWRFGATLSLGGNMKGKQSELNQTFTYTSFRTQAFKDTLSFVDKGVGSISLPIRFNYGIGAFINKKLYVGLNYAYEDWSTYTATFNNVPLSYSELNASEAYSLSMEYTPQKSRMINNGFWKTVNYRMGARIEDSYLTLNNNHLTIQAVSAGFGFPLLRSKSLTTINVGVEVGARKGESAEFVNENFTNIYLGMTFVPNKIDRWFVKRKYD
jgi:hypothetical protein